MQSKPVTNSEKKFPNSTCEGCIAFAQRAMTGESCDEREDVNSDADANICSVQGDLHPTSPSEPIFL